MSSIAEMSGAQRPPQGRGLARRFRRLLRRPAARLGLVILLFWAVLAVAWPLFAPDGPTDFSLIAKLAALRRPSLARHR